MVKLQPVLNNKEEVVDRVEEVEEASLDLMPGEVVRDSETNDNDDDDYTNTL